MIRRPPISTRTDTLFPYTTLFRSIVELLPSLRHRGLVGNGDHAHPTPELAQCVDHVERLRAAANLHYRKGPAPSGAHPGLFQPQPVDLILEPRRPCAVALRADPDRALRPKSQHEHLLPFGGVSTPTTRPLP